MREGLGFAVCGVLGLGFTVWAMCLGFTVELYGFMGLSLVG